MAQVLLTAEARKQVQAVPVDIRVRVAGIVARLEQWPAVSGAKPLRYDLKGSFRIRTGAYRVVFTVAGDVVTITAVDNRRDVYEK